MNNGWIKLSRDTKDHWTFADPKTFQMWIMLLLDLNMVDSSATISGKQITCAAGQSVRSVLSWSKLLNISPRHVRIFFAQLERSGHIRYENLDVTSRVTLLSGEADPKRVNAQIKVPAKSAAADIRAIVGEHQSELRAFEPFYNRYPGNKLPMEVEFGYLLENHEEGLSALLPLLLPGIEREIKQMDFLRTHNRFVRPYCSMRKWLRQQMWAQEFEKYQHDKNLDGPVYPKR